LARQRDIPWPLWLGCLAAALLAHAALVVPGGRVLARSLSGSFERRTGEREAIELELIEPDSSATRSLVESEAPNDRSSETTRIAERDAAVEREQIAAPVRTSKSATPGSSGSTKPITSQVDPEAEREPSESAAEELVDAADGRLSGDEPKPTFDEAERWRMLAGSPKVVGDNFATPRPPTSVAKVERGEQTLLDSRAHLYAAFFARMRERIFEHYDPHAAIARHDPRRVQIDNRARKTVVRVQLDRSGAIRKLSFIEESGVEYLDAEAVRTLRAAGPYPNPPAGLFDDDDTLVIHVGFKVPIEGSAGVYHSK
jgi:TonB family protein